jgi:hypothetical protein
MGCCPLFCFHDWKRSREDLDALQDRFVSVVLVADPFGRYDEHLLRRTFDLAIPFKEHFVAELARPMDEFTSARHRKCGRKVLRTIAVEVCSDPIRSLEE